MGTGAESCVDLVPSQVCDAGGAQHRGQQEAGKVGIPTRPRKSTLQADTGAREPLQGRLIDLPSFIN